MNSSVPMLVNAISSPPQGNSVPVSELFPLGCKTTYRAYSTDQVVDPPEGNSTSTIITVAAATSTSTTITTSTDNNNIISAFSISDTDVDDDYNDLPLLLDADDDVDTFATEYRARVLLPEILIEFKDDDWKKRNDLRYLVLVQDGLSSRPPSSSIPWVPAGHTQEAYDRMFMQYN